MAARTESARASSKSVKDENRDVSTEKPETGTPKDETPKDTGSPSEKPEGSNPETETGSAGSSDTPTETGSAGSEGGSPEGGSTPEGDKPAAPVSLLSDEEREKIRNGAKAYAVATEEPEDDVFARLLEAAEARKAEAEAKAAKDEAEAAEKAAREAFEAARKKISGEFEARLSLVRKFLPSYKEVAKSSAARSPSNGGNGTGLGPKALDKPRDADYVRKVGGSTKRNSITGRAILGAYDEGGISLSEVREIARSFGRKDSEDDAKRILKVDVSYIKGYGLRTEEVNGETRYFLVLPDGLDAPVFKD